MRRPLPSLSSLSSLCSLSSLSFCVAVPLALIATACTTVLGVTDVPDPDDGGASISDGAPGSHTDGGACAPGATKCSGSTLLRCLSNATWTTAKTCPFLCSQGQCAGECEPGSHQCAGNVPQTCDENGAWVNGAPCAVCTNGGCAGSCTPKTARCNGNTVQTCDASGTWQNTSTCPYACTNGVCGGQCSPNATQCVYEGTAFQPQVCSASGAWTSNGPSCCGDCQDGACQPGACATACYRVPSNDATCAQIYGTGYLYYFQCNGSCGASGPSLGVAPRGTCTGTAQGAGRTNSMPTGAWCAACDTQC